MSADRTEIKCESIEFEIDRSSPLATGASIGHGLLMPFVKAIEADMQPVERVHLWTGLFAATLGMMTAAVGPDDAEAIYHSLHRAFDEARGIQQLQSMQGAKGVH
jgi:hypothetical protein